MQLQLEEVAVANSAWVLAAAEVFVAEAAAAGDWDGEEWLLGA